MKITKLAVQVKNSNRVNVFIDNQYTLSLTLDQILSQKLKVGLELDQSVIKQLQKLSEDGKMRAKALEWVLLRPHSQKELKQEWQKKQVQPELISSICDEFARKGYQNDEAFARWWVENRARKNKSDRAIGDELRQKGISNEIISSALHKVDSQKERLAALVCQKRQLPKYQADPVKFKRYLLGKGFAYSDIVEVLEDATDAEPGIF